MTKSEKISLWTNAIVLLCVTIVIPTLIIWAQWSVNTKLANERFSEDSYNSATYAKQRDLENTNTKLDKIQEIVSSTDQHIARIEGAMQVNARRPKPQ